MELNEQVDKLAQEGIRVAAITYDKPEALAHFAKRRGIRYPLLADPASEVIRAFGILNTSVPRDSFAYGVPYPGTYLLDANGVVKAKYFEEDYRERTTAASILVRNIRNEAGIPVRETETRHLTLRASAANDSVFTGSRITLILDIDLKPKMHVYAPPVEGYIPIRWDIKQTEAYRALEVEFPEWKILHLPAIDERVPVYEGRFRLVRDIVIGQQKALEAAGFQDQVTVEGSFRYQACDDKMCYRPETVPLQWTFRLKPPDRERVPDALRRSGN